MNIGRSSIPYRRCLEGLTPEGLIGHICNVLQHWDWGQRRATEPYRGSQNDAQLLLQLLIRSYHDLRLKKRGRESIPSTELGYAALVAREGHILEHAIPAACIMWAIMNEVRGLQGEAAYHRITELLDETMVVAYVDTSENERLNKWRERMPEPYSEYGSWTGEAVWARYKKCGVPIPQLRDSFGRVLPS